MCTCGFGFDNTDYEVSIDCSDKDELVGKARLS